MAAHGKMRNAVNCAAPSPSLIRARIRAESRHFLPGDDEKVIGQSIERGTRSLVEITRGPMINIIAAIKLSRTHDPAIRALSNAH